MSNAAVLEMPSPAVAPKKKTRKNKDRRGPRGMGCVWLPKYRLSTGTKRDSHYYWIRYTDKNKQRHNENSFCTTKQGAQQVLTDRLNKVNRGEFTDFQRYQEVTLGQLLATLKSKYEIKAQRSADKLARCTFLLERHFGKDCPIAEVIARVDSYRVARLADEPKPSEFSIARELAALKAALRLGFDGGIVQRLPKIIMPDESGRVRDGEFSQKQFEAVMAELPAHVQPLVEFLYRTGMRVKEPLEMRWNEIDIQRGELRIAGRRTKNKQQKVLFLSGKPLDVLAARHAVKNGEFVFHRDGDQLDYWNALGYFQAVCTKLKISFTDPDGQPRTPGFHDLRRTFARMARRKGISDQTIMEIAGWKSYQMLRRYLGDSNEQDQRAAFARMDT